MNRFVLEDKSFRETDLIIEVLQQEKISYKLKNKFTTGTYSPKYVYGYDIWIFTDYEHFVWATKLIYKKTQEIIRLENSYELPSVDKTGKPIVQEKHIENITVKEYKPKKSMLKRIVDWVGQHV